MVRFPHSLFSDVLIGLAGPSDHAAFAVYRFTLMPFARLRTCAASYAAWMRNKWSTGGPNAFSTRSARSGDKAALPLITADKVARRTPRISAALAILRSSG